jgi:hypothetical protein
MKKLIWIVFVILPMTICVFGLLWLLRPWSQFGIGSHEESFDNYTVRVPYGWFAAQVEPDEKAPAKSPEMHRGIMAAGSVWFSSCIIRVDSADEYQARLKAGMKFPDMAQMKMPNLPTPTISPVEKLSVNGMPFERAYWTANLGNRMMRGVELRSVPTGKEDVVTIGANPGFGPPSELAQAEYMIMSLKRNGR